MGAPIPLPGARWKGTLFINVNAPRPEGWSETYHLVADSYGSAIAALDLIWEARRPTLAPDCLLEYGYVSDEGIKGDSILYQAAPGHLLGTYAGTDPHTLAAWNVVLVRMEAGPLYRILRPIRGIPTDMDLSGFTVPPGAYLTALNAYLAVLQANTLAHIKPKDGDPFGRLAYRGFTHAFILRYSERRDGRPFGLRHGRSKRQGVL